MFDHITLGVSDVARSTAFYDAVLAPLNLRVLWRDGEGAVGYGRKHPQFWIVIPLDESRPASVGNGTHTAFMAPSREAVEQFHAAALRAGGRDGGGPGLRPEYDADYYAAFVFDLDGHKIEAVHRSVAPR
jgi:catechol 2,3-dioxygenase-like lactoylglutathione lyase family enzyme